GDEARANELLDRAVQTAREAGIRRLDITAIVLLREADAAMEKQAWAQAGALLDWAEALAPGLPEILDARARLALGESPFALHRVIQLKIRAQLARFDDFQRRMLLLGDFVLHGLVAFGLLGLLFALCQVVRYGLNVFHDLGLAFPTAMRFVLLAAIAALMGVPLVFGFGPSLLLFPLMVVFWPYQGTGERVLSVVFILLLGATPWVLRMGDRLTEAGTGVTQALYATSLNPNDTRALETVEGAIEANGEDWLAQAVAGLAYKRLGRLDEAETALNAALSGAKGEVAGAIENSLGNVYFAQGRPRSAEKAYQAARAALPASAAPAFNLHRLYRRQGRMAEAEEAIQMASGVDAQQVASWTEDDDPSLNRFVVDLDLPTSALTRRAISDLFAPTTFARRAWLVLAGPVPEMAAPVAALITLALFGVLFSLRERMRLSWPCVRCARPAVVLLAEGPPDQPQCDQCVSLFVRGAPVDRRVRFAKEQSVARVEALRTWSTRVGGLLLPGLVDMVRGNAIRGAIVAGVALVLVLRLIEPDGLLFEPVPQPGAGGIRWWVVVVLALLWAAHAVRAFRWSEGRG
ncbi:MAG: hypothetical protein KC620_08465, partial [Myxococcales bacterium]|nr:hypothetical protein [Myxococcales bacterium]